MKRLFEKVQSTSTNTSFSKQTTGRQYPVMLVLVVLLLGFLLWAGFVPLAKGVVAPGTVVVDTLRKTIQHLEGGLVKAIHVREGSQVNANEVLIELDDTKARSERNMVRARYFMKFAELNRLKALSVGLQDLVFDEILLNVRHKIQIEELLTLQVNLFRVLRDEHDGRKLIFKHRVEQLKQKKKGLAAYRKIIHHQLSLLEKEISRLQGLLKKKLVDSAMVAERLQMLAQRQGELSKTTSDIWETDVAISEAKVSTLQLEREWQQSLSKQLSETQEAFVEVQSRLGAVQNVLERTTIRAPLAGTVIGLKLTTIWGVVAPGDPIMHIVPQGQKMVIEAHVSPLDIDSVQIGMNAGVRLISFRAKTTPELKGYVESVSADTLHDSIKSEPYYLVRVMMHKNKNLEQVHLVPGMPAEIFVDGGSRTLLQYLLDPISSVFKKGMREE